MVKEALEEYPQGRGDDMLLYLYILRKHYWRQVHVSIKPRLIIDYGAFENLLLCPSYETVRRRRQEFQAHYTHLRPSARVRRKRGVLQAEYRQEYKHQKAIVDFVSI